MGISFPRQFVGISFPHNDMGMKFRHNDVGISFPRYGLGTAMHGNRKVSIPKVCCGNFVPTTDFDKTQVESVQLGKTLDSNL